MYVGDINNLSEDTYCVQSPSLEGPALFYERQPTFSSCSNPMQKKKMFVAIRFGHKPMVSSK